MRRALFIKCLVFQYVSPSCICKKKHNMCFLRKAILGNPSCLRSSSRRYYAWFYDFPLFSSAFKPFCHYYLSRKSAENGKMEQSNWSESGACNYSAVRQKPKRFCYFECGHVGIAANLSTPHEVVFVIDFHYWPIASFKGAFFAGLSPEAAQIINFPIRYCVLR